MASRTNAAVRYEPRPLLKPYIGLRYLQLLGRFLHTKARSPNRRFHLPSQMGGRFEATGAALPSSNDKESNRLRFNLVSGSVPVLGFPLKPFIKSPVLT